MSAARSFKVPLSENERRSWPRNESGTRICTNSHEFIKQAIPVAHAFVQIRVDSCRFVICLLSDVGVAQPGVSRTFAPSRRGRRTRPLARAAALQLAAQPAARRQRQHLQVPPQGPQRIAKVAGRFRSMRKCPLHAALYATTRYRMWRSYVVPDRRSGRSVQIRSGRASTDECNLATPGIQRDKKRTFAMAWRVPFIPERVPCEEATEHGIVLKPNRPASVILMNVSGINLTPPESRSAFPHSERFEKGNPPLCSVISKAAETTARAILVSVISMQLSRHPPPQTISAVSSLEGIFARGTAYRLSVEDKACDE